MSHVEIEVSGPDTVKIDEYGDVFRQTPAQLVRHIRVIGTGSSRNICDSKHRYRLEFTADGLFPGFDAPKAFSRHHNRELHLPGMVSQIRVVSELIFKGCQ